MAWKKAGTATGKTILPPPGNFQGVDTRSKFTLVDKFLGYRSREDITKLAPGYMIEGSQNVLIDITERLKTRKGYTLDGQSNAALTGITSAFDWEEHIGGDRHMRGYGTNYQFRYVNAAGVVKWITIIATLPSGKVVRATNYWDNTEKLNELLFVAGDHNVYEWNGAIATYASSSPITQVITHLAVSAGGLLYHVNDVVNIPGGNNLATAKVLTVDGSGTVLTIAIVDPGQGYATSSAQPTSGGSGSGLTLDIVTSSTISITLQGTQTWAQLGFY